MCFKRVVFVGYINVSDILYLMSLNGITITTEGSLLNIYNIYMKYNITTEDGLLDIYKSYMKYNITTEYSLLDTYKRLLEESSHKRTRDVGVIVS